MSDLRTPRALARAWLLDIHARGLVAWPTHEAEFMDELTATLTEAEAAAHARGVREGLRRALDDPFRCLVARMTGLCR